MNDAEKIIQAFPYFLRNDVSSLIGKAKFNAEHPIAEPFEVILKKERLAIPYRIYLEEPTEQNLSEIELLILNCLFTRHHNGFIRQQKLERILLSDEYWVTPFVFQLLGEYVREIVEIIENNLFDKLLNNIIQFIKENPMFYEKTKSRIISYWACYYRVEFPKKEDYVGFKILVKISQLLGK